jgi:hypothetical protein
MLTVSGEGRGFRVIWLREVVCRLRSVDLLAVENDPRFPRNQPRRLHSRTAGRQDSRRGAPKPLQPDGRANAYRTGGTPIQLFVFPLQGALRR